jgi:hypothetical protein
MVNEQRPAAPRRRVRVQERDEEILRKHVARFRLTTYAVLHRLYWPNDTLNAVKSWVRRMREGGLLADAPLQGRTSYYHLTAHGAETLALDSRIAQPQKAGNLLRVFGHFAFCCMGDGVHRKLSVEDFKRDFSELVFDRLPNDEYYVDDTMHEQANVPARSRLGYILVDEARSVRRIRDVINREISRRLAVPAWKNDLIQKRSFVIAIATTSEGKGRVILEAVRPLHRDMLFRVTLLPQLRDVIHERKQRRGR